MEEIAKAVYLIDILFGKKDSKDRAEVENFIELANRSTVEELIAHLNKHLEMRMFLVGMNITAADVVIHLRIAHHFRNLKDSEKKELPHAFRWVDHVQHLPGMLEIVQSLGMFVSFPSDKEE
jgi:glutathione S-transferase